MHKGELIMRTKFFWFSILLAWLSAGCGSVSRPDRAINVLKSNAVLSKAEVEQVASVLSNFPNNVELSIALLQDTSVAYYGALRRNDSLIAVPNAQSVYEIGSLTKVFTSALLANWVYKNEQRLDAPVKDYLDVPFHKDISFTFRQLSNHTSGLPRIPSGFIWESLFHLSNPYKDYDEDKLRTYISNDMEIKTKPGTVYQYSNIGAGLLGYALAGIADTTYEALLQEWIFVPFDMRSSTTVRSRVQDRLIPGLNKRGLVTSTWDFKALAGAGAVLSTARDLGNFGRANFDTTNTILALQREKTFTIDDRMDIALGWHILKRGPNSRWYWHNGGTGGYRSSMVLDIEGKKGVVVLSNISSGHSFAAEIDSLSFQLLRSINM